MAVLTLVLAGRVFAQANSPWENAFSSTIVGGLVGEFGGDPAVADVMRVLRLHGFANKKYETDFYVEARKEATEIRHLRDFKLHVDSQDSPRHNYYSRPRSQSSQQANLSQPKHGWAFAKRALARGEEPQAITRQIAEKWAHDKSDPQSYARLTVVRLKLTSLERTPSKDLPPRRSANQRKSDLTIEGSPKTVYGTRR